MVVPTRTFAVIALSNYRVTPVILYFTLWWTYWEQIRLCFTNVLFIRRPGGVFINGSKPFNSNSLSIVSIVHANKKIYTFQIIYFGYTLSWFTHYMYNVRLTDIYIDIWFWISACGPHVIIYGLLIGLLVCFCSVQGHTTRACLYMQTYSKNH